MSTLRSSAALGAILSMLSVGCRMANPGTDEVQNPAGLDASFSMMLAAEGLDGAPNLYEVVVEPGDGLVAIRRGGDLPAQGQVITIGDLPAAPAAKVTAGLYKSSYDKASKTHACTAAAPLALVSGATATLAMTCLSLANDTPLPPVQVFVKVAKATITLTEESADAVLKARDWNVPSLFAAVDEKGRRVSVKQDALGGLLVHIGGDMTYLAEPSKPFPIARLLAGEDVALTAIAGALLQSAPEAATLHLAGKALLWEEDNGDLRGVLPLDLKNEPATITVQASVLEEPANAEFTVVSYNVENLFDQTDEDRNSGYGDYRIAPNAAGNGSNYGTPVNFNGQLMSYTDVKVEGIRKALTAIDPAGPEIVGMVEVESHASAQKVLDRMQDLGYQAMAFTDWPDDMPKPAIGQAVISKFPITETKLVVVTYPPAPAGATPEPSRPILRVKIDVRGQALFVYVNHWKSKGGPESMRKACAEALQADLAQLQQTNAKTDFIILGDLNSDYNEDVILEPQHNDTNGTTGINHVLRAQGDELAVQKGNDATIKYNLHYELDRAERRTAWYPGTGWGTLDNMIIGAGLYDRGGINYVDNSFRPVNFAMPRAKFLFRDDGTTHRWSEFRQGKDTVHSVGGYSDHLPIYARFQVAVRPNSGPIKLTVPGKPNADDPAL